MTIGNMHAWSLGPTFLQCRFLQWRFISVLSQNSSTFPNWLLVRQRISTQSHLVSKGSYNVVFTGSLFSPPNSSECWNVCDLSSNKDTRLVNLVKIVRKQKTKQSITAEGNLFDLLGAWIRYLLSWASLSSCTNCLSTNLSQKKTMLVWILMPLKSFPIHESYIQFFSGWKRW